MSRPSRGCYVGRTHVVRRWCDCLITNVTCVAFIAMRTRGSYNLGGDGRNENKETDFFCMRKEGNNSSTRSHSEQN